MDTLLFYINAINGGGAERVILQLAHHFADEGYRSVLVTSFVDEGKEYEVPDNVTRISIEQEEIKQSRLKRNISRIRALRRIVKKEKPAAVISFMAEPNFRALIATIGLKTKRIISVRNDPNREYSGRVGRFVGTHILPKADGCVFQTDDAKAWFPDKLQKKSRVILNDVKEEFFDIQREQTRNVISVGRLSKQKNHALLISAYASIADKHPDQNLLIYGAGALEAQLRQQITNLDLKERAFLMGPTSDVGEALSNARVFVLSSDYEGMPNCLMEALAAGVPCISTDCPCGGPRALIKDGENGLLVPIKDKEALANAIDKLLSDFDYAETIGKNAKESASQFHPERIFYQWKAYVEDVIDSN
jgi:glycosyltransferase involved in cell wall biosynthesis